MQQILGIVDNQIVGDETSVVCVQPLQVPRLVGPTRSAAALSAAPVDPALDRRRLRPSLRLHVARPLVGASVDGLASSIAW